MRKGFTCITCGHDRFYANQIIRTEVIVDGYGDFIENPSGGIEPNIYDSEHPYGPFKCEKCGQEYDELTQARMEISAKLMDKSDGVAFQKAICSDNVENLMLNKRRYIKEFAEEKKLSGEYEVSILFTDAGEYVDSDEEILDFKQEDENE